MKNKLIFAVIVLCLLIIGCKGNFTEVTGGTTVYEAYEVGDNTSGGQAENISTNQSAAGQNEGIGQKVDIIILP